MWKLTRDQRKERRKSVQAWQDATAARLPPWFGRRFLPVIHHLDLWLIDYGILREAYSNLHKVSDGIWRSAQPAPRHLRQLADRGVRTIVNLRGDESLGAHQLELEACRRLGLELFDLKLKSRAAPTRSVLAEARRVIAAIEKPTLIHCKSGSDRTGIFCALYLILRENVPVAEASRQLAPRYGHLRWTKTGILDYFFDAYREHVERSPMSFTDWLDTVYDPEALEANYAERRWYRRAAPARDTAVARLPD